MYVLTHLLLVWHICVGESDQHWFRSRLLACLAPSNYLNQCLLIFYQTPGNKFQWNLNRNSIIFIQRNVFENVVCEMAAILSRGDELTCLSLTVIICDSTRCWIIFKLNTTITISVDIYQCVILSNHTYSDPMSNFCDRFLELLSFKCQELVRSGSYISFTDIWLVQVPLSLSWLWPEQCRTYSIRSNYFGTLCIKHDKTFGESYLRLCQIKYIWMGVSSFWTNEVPS